MIFIKFDQGKEDRTLSLTLLKEDDERNLVEVTEQSLNEIDLIGAATFEMLANNTDKIMDKIMTNVVGLISKELIEA